MSDESLQELETQFPAISGQAFAAAREQVLASGQSVLQSDRIPSWFMRAVLDKIV